jgi:L-threonylcarbamoyladenylate synthase
MEVFHSDRISERDFDQILSVLRAGGVIGFPTDTAYGLGADPFNEAAVDRIFEIKGRTERKAILLVVSSRAMLQQVAQPSALFDRVADTFWPGPLTLVLPAVPSLPSKLTGGSATIGVRLPDAAFATSLAERLGKPLTATSANRSDMPAAVTAEEVSAQLGDSIDVLIDGGRLPARAGSSLLDLTVDPPVLLREGPISFARLEDFFGGRIRRPQA